VLKLFDVSKLHDRIFTLQHVRIALQYRPMWLGLQFVLELLGTARDPGCVSTTGQWLFHVWRRDDRDSTGRSIEPHTGADKWNVRAAVQ
jgi:hypothetical protein